MNPEKVRGKVLLCEAIVPPCVFSWLGAINGVIMQSGTRDNASSYPLPAALVSRQDVITIFRFTREILYVSLHFLQFNLTSLLK